MQRILITGGTGFIGTALVAALLGESCQITILTRSPQKFRPKFAQAVSLVDRLDAIDTPIDVVINLAGANLFARRWTHNYKTSLYESRVSLTRSLVQWMQSCTTPPAVFISGSAVGYYGDRGDERLTESSLPGDDFGAQLCRDWESEANKYELGRVVCLRTGIVLGYGGALKNMLPAFRLGLGAILGQGSQYWSWISLHDVVNAIRFIMTKDIITGPVNLCAPEPRLQSDFAKTLAKQLRRPCFLRIPALMLRLLIGEASQILLASQRCIPSKLLEHGFQFRHPKLSDALKAIL